jgi:hypothetical protein
VGAYVLFGVSVLYGAPVFEDWIGTFVLFRVSLVCSVAGFPVSDILGAISRGGLGGGVVEMSDSLCLASLMRFLGLSVGGGK